MPINSLESLFTIELKDMYDAEKRLTKALPKMAKAAASDELRNAFQEHLEITKGHVARLEEVFQMVGVKPQAKTCEAMKGLIEEGDEAVGESGGESLLDLNLVGAARRVEHYEMAAYKTLIGLAQGLGKGDKIGKLLSQTLSEEEEADRMLSQLAETLVEEANSEVEQEEDAEQVGPGHTTSSRR